MALECFAGYADPVLYDQVRSAALQGPFRREERFAEGLHSALLAHTASNEFWWILFRVFE
jgi:hypothetical protein